MAVGVPMVVYASTIVREAAHYNHDVSKFVTPNVEAALKKKIREGKV